MWYNKVYLMMRESDNDKKVFEKLGVKNNYTLIKGSGVDKEQFIYHKPLSNKKINITFTGRILKDKGILELIKAVEILPHQIRSKVVLNIYGKIDLENPAHIIEKELKKLLKPNFIESKYGCVMLLSKKILFRV